MTVWSKRQRQPLTLGGGEAPSHNDFLWEGRGLPGLRPGNTGCEDTL